jgi:hypothetical protein
MDKPKALRLAEWLDSAYEGEAQDAAAELRRLHAVNQELLEALKPLVHDADVLGWDTQQAHATIAKAEGQQ